MSPSPPPPEAGHPGEIFIIVNRNRVGPFHNDEVTGREIKEKAGLPLTGELSRITEHGLVPVKNDERIHIHEGEKFEYVPPTPASR